MPNIALDPGDSEGTAKRPSRGKDSPDTITNHAENCRGGGTGVRAEHGQVNRRLTALTRQVRGRRQHPSATLQPEGGGSTHQPPCSQNGWGLGRPSMERGYAARKLTHPSAGQRIAAGTSLQNRLVWGWEDGSMGKVLATQEFRAPEAWDTMWAQLLACNSTLGQQRQRSPEQARHGQ